LDYRRLKKLIKAAALSEDAEPIRAADDSSDAEDQAEDTPDEEEEIGKQLGNVPSPSGSNSAPTSVASSIVEHEKPMDLTLKRRRPPSSRSKFCQRRKATF